MQLPEAASDGGIEGGHDRRDARVADERLDAGKDVARGPAPSLSALDVTWTGAVEGSSPEAMVPAFSADVHDYFVRCAAGKNALTVSMTAAPGATTLLLEPTPSASLPSQTIELEVSENDAIVAMASNDSASVEYWVRCLPHDMPTIDWVPTPGAPARPTAGYYLLGNLYPSATSKAYAVVLDSNGVPVWYASAPLKHSVYEVDTIVPGTISFIDILVDVDWPPYQLHQLGPLAVTALQPQGYNCNEHELRLLPNGNYVMFSQVLRTGFDMRGWRVPVPGGGSVALTADTAIQDCVVLEVTSDGRVQNTWVSTDHFDPGKDTRYPQLAATGTAPDGGPVVDPFHCNAIDVDPTNGSLLISARHMDSVFYVSWPDGAVLWKMGGSTYSKDATTYVTPASPFFRQHDARLRPGWSPTCHGGSGQISMYDDQTGVASKARAVVYDVVVGGADGGMGGAGCDGGGGDAEAGSATVAWQTFAPTNASSLGSFRILSDGSRVIDWGALATHAPVFSEVDALGNHLVDVYMTGSSGPEVSYRVIKVPLSSLDLDDLRRAAGQD